MGVGAYYMGTQVDATRLMIYGMPAPGVTLEALDKALDEEVKAFLAAPPAAADLERAKTRLVADAVYAQDNQTALARWYGAALATGESLDDIRTWPTRIDAVTAEQVHAVANKWLRKSRAVTGYLMPEPDAGPGLEPAVAA